MDDPTQVALLQERVAELERQLTAERSVSDSEQQFRTLANSIPQLAWMADGTGYIFWYNQRWYDYTGSTLDQMQGWGWRRVHHPDHVRRVVESMQHAFETGEPWEDTFPLRCRTGEWRWFLSRALPIHDAEGRVVRWFGTNTDITEQLESAREHERLLAESEQNRALLDALFENAPVGLCFWDRELRYTRLNRALAAINGLPVEAHLGKTPQELLPEVAPEVMWAFDRVLNTGDVLMNVEVSGKTLAVPGVRRTWLASFYPVRIRGTIAGIGGVIAEITDRKAAEQALKDVRERLELHLNNTPVAIIEFDADFKVLRWSPEAERVFGWTAEEVVGKSSRELGLVYEEDQPLFDAMARQMKLTKESSYHGANRNRHKNGSIVSIDWYNSVIRNAGGELVSILSFGVDVTARKNAEEALHRHAEDLARSNAELQQFAYAASHDLQEPLRMVSLYTELLRRRYGARLDGEADRYINFAVEGARRMERLLRDLLDYSRVNAAGTPPPAPVECDAVVRKVLFTLDERIRETSATVEFGWLPRVMVQEVHLLQVFQNLISNALKYRRENEAPRVRILVERDGPRWRFSVADNGVGVDQKYHKQIFGLFKRLHSDRSGSGIGLAICHRVVERYGGMIWVESAGEGRGCTFRFTLPGCSDTVR